MIQTLENNLKNTLQRVVFDDLSIQIKTLQVKRDQEQFLPRLMVVMELNYPGSDGENVLAKEEYEINYILRYLKKKLKPQESKSYESSIETELETVLDIFNVKENYES